MTTRTPEISVLESIFNEAYDCYFTQQPFSPAQVEADLEWVRVNRDDLSFVLLWLWIDLDGKGEDERRAQLNKVQVECSSWFALLEGMLADYCALLVSSPGVTSSRHSPSQVRAQRLWLLKHGGTVYDEVLNSANDEGPADEFRRRFQMGTEFHHLAIRLDLVLDHYAKLLNSF